MVALKSLAAFVASAIAVSSHTAQAVAPADLPIFFFHGLTGNVTDAANFAANLTAEGRTFTALGFCESACSTEALNTQVPLALAELRGIIANDTATYENGYIFIGHSQGGAISRAVIEEMDEHNVQLYISLAGVQNGIFYGPQDADQIPMLTFVDYFGPASYSSSVLNFSSYTTDDYQGKFQYDYDYLLANTPELSATISGPNLYRSPDHTPWLSWNPWLPMLNNLEDCSGNSTCEAAQAQRRSNFIKLKSFHSFASPRDGAVAPWQTSHFAQYNDVANETEIESAFASFEIQAMETTTEYLEDTYGLQTLDTSGRLHLHEVADVNHACWLRDTYFSDDTTELCEFDFAYSSYVYPLLTSTVDLESASSSSSGSSTGSGSSASSGTSAVCADATA